MYSQKDSETKRYGHSILSCDALIELMTMTARDQEMVQVLDGKHRGRQLRAVLQRVDKTASLVLDLGCGIGVLASPLAECIPSATIIGLDHSAFMLAKLQTTRMTPHILPIQAEAPFFPLKPASIDLVVAVQVLHEVLAFMGRDALFAAIEGIHRVLRQRGTFIVLDHQNPGATPIRVHLPESLLETLNKFKVRFKPRVVDYEADTSGWIRLSIRDFYDFITKIWAIDTALETEEMNETHTPFTGQEFAAMLVRAGFEVLQLRSITPVKIHLDHFGVTVEPETGLPDRHLLITAKKASN